MIPPAWSTSNLGGTPCTGQRTSVYFEWRSPRMSSSVTPIAWPAWSRASSLSLMRDASTVSRARPVPAVIGYARSVVTRRSGAPSRFLFHRAPESWVLPGDLLIINGLFGFLPLFAAVFGFASCGADAARALFDPSDPIALLSRPLGPHEHGAVHVSGRIQGGEVCLVTHEHFDKLWTEDWVG